MGELSRYDSIDNGIDEVDHEAAEQSDEGPDGMPPGLIHHNGEFEFSSDQVVSFHSHENPRENTGPQPPTIESSNP